jgi:hypothetical protein
VNAFKHRRKQGVELLQVFCRVRSSAWDVRGS